MGILTLRALKAEKLQALLDDLVWDESLLIQLPSASFEMLMRYILDRDLDKPAFRRRLKTLRNPKLKESAMTLAEQLHEEGMQRGQVAAKQQYILETLMIRFDRVPEGLREEIESIADTAKLQALLRAAIRSSTLEEFAESL